MSASSARNNVLSVFIKSGSCGRGFGVFFHHCTLEHVSNSHHGVEPHPGEKKVPGALQNGISSTKHKSGGRVPAALIGV